MKKKRSSHVPVPEDKIVKALWATGGFIGKAAKKLNVTQAAVSNRIKKRETLKVILDEIIESHLDVAECKLIGLIKKSDLAAIRYYLDNKGKSRGYSKVHEVEISVPKGPLVIVGPASDNFCLCKRTI